MNFVFDLGGVLIDWDPRYLYRKLLPNEEEVERFLAHICTPEWNVQQDAGHPFADGIAELVEIHPRHESLIRAYRERWEEMLGGLIEDNVLLLKKLKSMGAPLYALSNWSAETFPIAEKRYDFLRLFDKRVISGEVGLIKPDVPIYWHLLETNGLIADDTVFIDDRLENVETAQSLGLHGIHFVDPDQLRKELNRFIALN